MKMGLEGKSIRFFSTSSFFTSALESPAGVQYQKLTSAGSAGPKPQLPHPKYFSKSRFTTKNP
jgi:hypothetical protein